MLSSLLCLVAAGTLLLAAPAFAQSAPPVATYTGPRYPGGPDSLRALVGRSTRQITPGFAGRTLVQFELKPDGQPYNFGMVRPPDPLRQPLVDATTTALSYLAAHMRTWQPTPPDPNSEDKKSSKGPKVSLVLDFGALPAGQPYEYADQNPVFANMVAELKLRNRPYFDQLQNDPAQLVKFQSSLQGLVTMIQLSVRYPFEALRTQQQGTVYACFEIAENGAIEHPEILGTAGRALDAEVLQAMSKLPAATTPAQLQGQPVRVRYTVPITFKIQ